MTDTLVGEMPSDDLGIVEDFVGRLRREAGFRERYLMIIKGEVPIPPVAQQKLSRPFPKIEKMLSGRFKTAVTVDPYPEVFTPEFLARAAGFNLQPVFLPGEEITQERELKKWTRPGNWFYQEISKGTVKPYDGHPPLALRRGWYLADFTLGVDYTDGTQVMPNDPWTPLITRLRQEGQLGKNEQTPLGSRFAITHQEWESVLFPYMASALMVSRVQIRLERAVEFNAIGNLYDRNRGRFNVWEWFSDRFGESGRLLGGRRHRGGLAGVFCYWAGGRGGGVAGRPLVSFVS